MLRRVSWRKGASKVIAGSGVAPAEAGGCILPALTSGHGLQEGPSLEFPPKGRAHAGSRSGHSCAITGSVPLTTALCSSRWQRFQLGQDSATDRKRCPGCHVAAPRGLGKPGSDRLVPSSVARHVRAPGIGPTARLHGAEGGASLSGLVTCTRWM